MKKEADYSYFQNRACAYFPCHSKADPDNFNCLFCFCPLYALGSKCGGNFTFTADGTKDCSNCLLPHSAGGYDYVCKQFNKIKDAITEIEKTVK